ncbi:hypothetical protein JP74_18945 [Devosia sp. 17-2-E-8]|nr:hypothetical protein JP74_18945 [Devosia sp. 17-2-E-8]
MVSSLMSRIAPGLLFPDAKEKLFLCGDADMPMAALANWEKLFSKPGICAAVFERAQEGVGREFWGSAREVDAPLDLSHPISIFPGRRTGAHGVRHSG